jgi:hypothetical protein
MMVAPETSPTPRPGRSPQPELALIGVATGMAAAAGPWLPHVLIWGELACVAAGLLLLQGLIRDLIMIRVRKRAAASCALPLATSPERPPVPTRCMCMESSVGSIGLAVGCLLLVVSPGGVVRIPWWFWSLMSAAVLLFGWYIKDFVIDWKGRRILRVTNHAEVKW